MKTFRESTQVISSVCTIILSQIMNDYIMEVLCINYGDFMEITLWRFYA